MNGICRFMNGNVLSLISMCWPHLATLRTRTRRVRAMRRDTPPKVPVMTQIWSCRAMSSASTGRKDLFSFLYFLIFSKSYLYRRWEIKDKYKGKYLSHSVVNILEHLKNIRLSCYLDCSEQDFDKTILYLCWTFCSYKPELRRLADTRERLSPEYESRHICRPFFVRNDYKIIKCNKKIKF